MSENNTESTLKEQFESNKNLKLTTYLVGGVVLLVIASFAYYQFMWTPNNEKSKASYFEALNYAEKDSTDLAIDLLKPAVKKYDGKVGGEIAQFTLARQLMAKGEFSKAIEELEGVDLEDEYLSVMSIGLQGDCLSEMKKYEEAETMYIKAAELGNNDFTSPMYFFKAALCAEKTGDLETALHLYKNIENNFTDFANQKSIKKYIARVNKK